MLKKTAFQLLKLTFAAFSVLILALIFTAIFLAYDFYTRVPVLDEDKLLQPATTIIYDYQGTVAAQLQGPQHRIPVSLEKLPTFVSQSVLAVEDARFYTHQGFDLRSILRAALVNYRSGKVVEGASTITQQLVKNSYLTSERTWQRKFTEIHMAYHLEKKIGKNRILETYLNSVYFGNGAYGIEAAAKVYFGKSAKHLTIGESALLAGLIRSPSSTDPFRQPQNARERRNIVLSQMETLGWLPNELSARLKEEPLRLNSNALSLYNYPHPYFLDHVIEEAVKVHGLTERQLFNGGLHIYTSLNREIQSSAERLFEDSSLFPDSPDQIQVEAALAAIDPRSGHIQALVGGRDYKARRGFNRATMAKRSPGSALKPLAVYAPALESGWSKHVLLPDKEININGYSPKNYDGYYRGNVSMGQALAWSLNVPAVWLLNQIGVDKTVNTFRKLGLPLHSEDRYLSLALGGMTNGLSPLELSQGYAALANGGYKVQPLSIIQIYDSDEQPLLKPINKDRVFSFETCKTITAYLQGVVEFGTGKEAKLDWPIAGKTGTTELPPLPEFRDVQGNKDAWFVGYSPELVTTVWMGYDLSDSGHYLSRVYGGSFPAQMFRLFMESVLPFVEKRDASLFEVIMSYPSSTSRLEQPSPDAEAKHQEFEQRPVEP